VLEECLSYFLFRKTPGKVDVEDFRAERAGDALNLHGVDASYSALMPWLLMIEP
jgi:hypothetical protein